MLISFLIPTFFLSNIRVNVAMNVALHSTSDTCNGRYAAKKKLSRLINLWTVNLASSIYVLGISAGDKISFRQ